MAIFRARRSWGAFPQPGTIPKDIGWLDNPSGKGAAAGNAEMPLKSRGGSVGKPLPIITGGLLSRVQALPLNNAHRGSRNSELKEAKP